MRRENCAGTPLRCSDAARTILSPRHFVAVRKTSGGPAPGDVPAIVASDAELQADQDWWKDATNALRQAETKLAT
jgi:hypothetical protein